MNRWKTVFVATALLISNKAISAPFSACPVETFLVQQKKAVMFGVQLATGSYNLIEDNMNTNSKVNAMGFNMYDNYLYAWSREYGTLAKIGSDYQVQPLVTTNKPDTSFFVGDVALDENAWYGYRNNSGHGLYKVSLDPNDSNYLNFVKVIDSSAQNLNVFDMAFHPSDGHVYMVAKDGAFWRMDPTTGETDYWGNVGQKGVFGAAYFDVDGKLYISRNSDGYIFRINAAEWGASAEFFAFGPSSGNNDGARCAMAAVTEAESEIDFGDAPDSYGTNLDSNGARHQLTNSLYLGSTVDKEGDASVYPLSDDLTDGTDDDDGVEFVTALEVGFDAVIRVTASTNEGYLNAWIDWNQNGVFDSDEQIADDIALNAGSQNLVVSVPNSSEYGNTWARFRISDTRDIDATGGVDNGEVEDYPVELVEASITTTHYPAAGDWATLAYEDNWPEEGDYDMNDLVVHYRVTTNIHNGQVISTRIQGEVVALGAAFHNGFAVRLPNITPSLIDESNIKFRINGSPVNTSPLEANRTEAIFVVTDDIFKHVGASNGCRFYRTEPGCNSPTEMSFSIKVPFTSPIATTELSAPYDPFIFATPGYPRGGVFSEWPGRSLEIHLAGMEPTEAFNTNFFGLADDTSNPALNRYFVTSNGMPWAQFVANDWVYPAEYNDLLKAYPKFRRFAESGGSENQDWFTSDNKDTSHTYNH